MDRAGIRRPRGRKVKETGVIYRGSTKKGVENDSEENQQEEEEQDNAADIGQEARCPPGTSEVVDEVVDD